MNDQKQTDKDFVEISEAFNAKIRAKIKNSLSARYFPKNYEVNTLPSKTVPDQSMPLKTILERFARGLPITSAVQQPIWDDDNQSQGIDLRKLDLAEKEQIMDETKEVIQKAKRPKETPKQTEKETV